MGVKRSGASVWDDAERHCELSFQMGNGEFPISARYPSRESAVLGNFTTAKTRPWRGNGGGVCERVFKRRFERWFGFLTKALATSPA